jgi:murein DD-endopeptidase MepM/ murein hydrolase activator NlpD
MRTLKGRQADNPTFPMQDDTRIEQQGASESAGFLSHRRPVLRALLAAAPLCMFAAAVYFVAGAPLATEDRPPAPPVADPPVAAARAAPALREIRDRFRRNETVSEALGRHGLAPDEVRRLVDCARPLHNLARIMAGREYILHFTSAGEFRDFIYPVDEERYLTVYSHQGRLVPVMKNFLYATEIESVAGNIEDSLFMAVRRAGEQDQLALDLAAIFQWDIDFYTDLQEKDSFRLLVEKKYLDGEFKKYGAILAAEFTVSGRTFWAFRFADGDKPARYYDHEGRALNKTFLKSPLQFTRISSGFSFARRDPITRIVRPHLGVDYAAPPGTPVVAVASGRVVFAGARGGYGNLVQLRHARGYETMYAHLQSILVAAGAQVGQGQLIGRVGQTGHATGPHLDFRVLQHGKFLNPRRVAGPPEPPVPAASMARFAAWRDRLKDRMNALPAFTEGSDLR